MLLIQYIFDIQHTEIEINENAVCMPNFYRYLPIKIRSVIRQSRTLAVILKF